MNFLHSFFTLPTIAALEYQKGRTNGQIRVNDPLYSRCWQIFRQYNKHFCTDTHTERRRKMKGQLNEKLIQFSTVFIVSRLCQLIIVVELLLVTGLRCCNI